MPKTRINVDVDGTLTKGEKKYWKEECEPDEHMIEIVNELYKAGNTIVIWTARPLDNARDLSAWLQKYGVRYHALRMDKGSSDVYIDDKAIRPEELKTASKSPEEVIKEKKRL